MQAKVTSQLVRRSYVRAADIAVLSFYPSQVQLIQNALHKKNIPGISVLPVEPIKILEKILFVLYCYTRVTWFNQ